MQNLNQISKCCLDVEVIGGCFALHFLELTQNWDSSDLESKSKSYIFTLNQCGDTFGDILIGWVFAHWQDHKEAEPEIVRQSENHHRGKKDDSSSL